MSHGWCHGWNLRAKLEKEHWTTQNQTWKKSTLVKVNGADVMDDITDVSWMMSWMKSMRKTEYALECTKSNLTKSQQSKPVKGNGANVMDDVRDVSWMTSQMSHGWRHKWCHQDSLWLLWCVVGTCRTSTCAWRRVPCVACPMWTIPANLSRVFDDL